MSSLVAIADRVHGGATAAGGVLHTALSTEAEQTLQEALVEGRAAK